MDKKKIVIDDIEFDLEELETMSREDIEMALDKLKEIEELIDNKLKNK